MVVPAVKEKVLRDLDKLSPDLQERAADFVHSLVSTTPPGTPPSELRRHFGVLDAESADEILAAIEEGCGQVDLDEW